MKKLVIAVLASIALASCGNSSTSSSTTTTSSTTADTVAPTNNFEYTMTIGENTGADVVIEVMQGATVTLKAVNPESHDDVHLHGYDLTTGVIEKGEVGSMTFQATKTGDFEIESHETGELISILRVSAP